jgi:hypothetical protein
MVGMAASSTMADAAIYQWQDDKGVIHFTDNSDSIPQRYESRAKEVAGVSATEKPKAAEAAATQSVPPAAVPGAATAEPSDRRLRELQALRQMLPDKKKELAKLRHKYVIAKGRNPTKEEIEKFEKKRAKGDAKFEDNPYVNHNPLSTPGPSRVAYYKKLEEIKKDEERIRILESELPGK